MTINPVNAITGATADVIPSDTLVRNFCSAAMRKAATIGGLPGCHIDESPEQRDGVSIQSRKWASAFIQAEAWRAILAQL